jgi:hypothetical protein
LLLQNALFRFYNGNGPVPPGEEGGPEPFAAETMALSSLVSSVLYVDPNGDDPGVHGPGGPVMRDIITSIGIARLASTMTNKDVGNQMRIAALDNIVAQAEELRSKG